MPETIFNDGFEDPDELTITSISPSQARVGELVVIDGFHFNSPSGQPPLVTLDHQDGGTVSAAVSEFSDTHIIIVVPTGATTGPVSVTVSGDTVMSPTDLIVLQVPVVDSIWPRAALPEMAVPGFAVTGANLVAVSVEFQPVSDPPLLPVNSLVLAPDGNSAMMDVYAQPGSAGEYVVVATNLAGSSNTVAADANRFMVFANGDADNDGLTDGEEVTLGTDPFDKDTDGDGWSDEAEVSGNGDPLDAGTGPAFTVVASRPRVKIIMYELGLETADNTVVVSRPEIKSKRLGIGTEPADNTVVASRPSIEVTRLEVGTEAADNTIVASPPQITVEREQL